MKKFSPSTQRWLQRGLIAAAILGLAILTAWLAFVVTRNLTFSQALAQGPGGPVLRPGEPTPTPQLDEQGAPLLTPRANPNAPAAQPTLTPWDGAGRVTVLLLGLDYRDWSQGIDYSRSDTMILLTLDPLTRSAGILSIPRDTWVPIPGFKHGKINTAYYLGDAYKLPGGGPGLAVKTVEQFLGVPINYYAQIDFEAFVRFIDEIGGVKIDVPEQIKIDLLGDNNTKVLKPGVQVLPGEWALAYARARYTEGGDFARAARQQQVIFAIRDRILSFDMLPTLIQKAPVLYQQLSSGIHTNMSLDEVIKLAVLASQVPKEQIKQGVIGEKYIVFGRSPDNLSINIPIPDKVLTLRDEIFATGSSLNPYTPGSSEEQMALEAARLAVYNASSTPGLASQVAGTLGEKGVQVVEVGDSGNVWSSSALVVHNGTPYLIKYLAETYGIPPARITMDYNPAAAADVELYLGNNAAQ